MKYEINSVLQKGEKDIMTIILRINVRLRGRGADMSLDMRLSYSHKIFNRPCVTVVRKGFLKKLILTSSKVVYPKEI